MRYLLVRESGGLGDVIRIGAPAKALHQKDPDAYVCVVGIEDYGDILRMLRGIDEVRTIPYPNNRVHRMDLRFAANAVDFNIGLRQQGKLPNNAINLDKIPYLAEALAGEWDEIIDLFCPGFAIEYRALKVEFNRNELYCTEAGVYDWTNVTPEIMVPAQCWDEASKALQSVFPKKFQPLIAFAVRGTDTTRTLPKDKAEQLVAAVRSMGMATVYMDTTPRPELDALGLKRITTSSWSMLAAFAKGVDAFISVDTGAYHLAAAVGTPAVVLAGNQNPDILVRSYPKHVGIASDEFLSGKSDQVPFCSPPCTYNPQRGWDPERCRDRLGGCYFLNSIKTPRIIEGLRSVLVLGPGRRWSKC